MYEQRPTNRKVTSFCDTHAPFVRTPRPDATELTEDVKAGLKVIDDLRANQAVRDVLTYGIRAAQAAVRPVRPGARVQEAARHLAPAPDSDVRAVADGLELLRTTTDPDGRAAARDTFDRLLGGMADGFAEARGEADGLPTAEDEAAWLGVADEAVRVPRGAAAGDPGGGAGGKKSLDSILRTQPSRINALLVGAVNQLRLDDLLKTLAAVRAVVPAARADEVARAATAAGPLVASVSRVLSDHMDWQAIDKDLGQLEQELLGDSPVEVCMAYWEGVRPKIEAQI